jgi:hypothetical protein
VLWHVVWSSLCVTAESGYAVAQVWADTPQVMVPLLKFMGEVVQNKTSRVTFENISPNGILLFKETSKLLVAFGIRTLAMPVPPVRLPCWCALRRSVCACRLSQPCAGCVVDVQPTDVYPKRYKCISLALKVRL